jgi:NitT/TauT family transport system substrate-binding protein
MHKEIDMTTGNLAFDPATDLKIRYGRNWGRREFVRGLGALAGSAALLGYHLRPAAAEPPPETTRIRLIDDTTICIAPVFVAEALLKSEGFTDVRYIRVEDETVTQRVAAGEADLGLNFAVNIVTRLDAGDPVLVLAGVHPGCMELFATDRVRVIRDLKDKTVAILSQGYGEHLFLASMVAYVGLDPRKDIHWVEHPYSESVGLLADGKVDAFLAFPPNPQELRAQRIGHVVVNTSTDKPWSQYYRCMLYGNRDFVRKHPVATKRAMRAILKATDICAQEPERAARFVVDRGYASSYDYTVQTLKEVPYNAWRTYDPEDTLRFYALRLHEVGMIKASPQKIITQGTDWRLFNELKKELKA